MVQRPLLFLLFFISGFCGLAYQVIWTRLAFAAFGIITPVLSVVISVFMLGLAIGAWVSGRWVGTLVQKTRLSAVTLYALAELGIEGTVRAEDLDLERHRRLCEVFG